jgi:hypothetical protein
MPGFNAYCKLNNKTATLVLLSFVIIYLIMDINFKQFNKHVNEKNKSESINNPFRVTNLKHRKKFRIEDEFNKIKRHFYGSYCEEAFSRAKDKIEIEQTVPSVIKPFQLYLNKNAKLNYTRFNNLENKTFETYFDHLFNVKRGGRWAPSNCRARHRVAVIIPYRDREENLNIFLFNMHPLLQRQELNYSIFVVEQTNDVHFNKGILMNAAFKEIFLKNRFNLEFDCVVYHDVDVGLKLVTLFFFF